MKGRDKEFSTQDSFSAYLKTAVKNTKIKYIKRHIKIQENEMPIEESTNFELESHKDDYFDYLEKKVSRLYGDSSDIEQLLNLIENERLLNALCNLTE